MFPFKLNRFTDNKYFENKIGWIFSYYGKHFIIKKVNISFYHFIRATDIITNETDWYKFNFDDSPQSFTFVAESLDKYLNMQKCEMCKKNLNA